MMPKRKKGMMMKRMKVTTLKSSIAFKIEENKIYLIEICGAKLDCPQNKFYNHSQIYLTEGDQTHDKGNRYGEHPEILQFNDYKIVDKSDYKEVEIIESNQLIEVITYYRVYQNFNIVSAYKKIRNISNQILHLENASSIYLYGIIKNDGKGKVYKPFNSNYSECQWRKVKLLDEGVFEMGIQTGHKRGVMANCGSQSSKEYIPMGILENGRRKVMWHIMSDSVWHAEYGNCKGKIYLNAGGPSFTTSGFIKKLQQNEEYATSEVSVSIGKDIDSLVQEFTDLRRFYRKDRSKNNETTIFNEYMHLSYDRPAEETTQKYCELLSKYGINYYVIDAYWHDETCESDKYQELIGNWKESKARFPSGLKKTLDYMRGFGYKVGLWVEIQSVGRYCDPLPLPDDCFFHFHGEKTVHNFRLHLDFSKSEVRKWATEIFDRLIKEYQVDYFKIDYNQNSYGNENGGYTLAESLENHSRGYYEWYNSYTKKHPEIMFESCASGGQSINPLMLSVCDVMSISDQQNKYAFARIAANIGSAVLPEQAAIWCCPQEYKRRLKGIETPDGDIIINMVNPLFHRIHLASYFFDLPDNQLNLIKEGLAYYKEIAKVRHESYPVFPQGFNYVEKASVISGLKSKEKLYIAVYNLDEKARTVKVNLKKYGVKTVKLGYPSQINTEFSLKNGELNVMFDAENTARVFEFNL